MATLVGLALVGPALLAGVGGAVATALYLWRRDLLANMIGHAIADTVGLAVTA